jgi:hypothetical protein
MACEIRFEYFDNVVKKSHIVSNTKKTGMN